MASNVLPLGFVSTGHTAVVSDLTGGSSFCQRLAELGLARGVRVKVVNNETGGSLIISVGQGRLAIGRGMSLKILVEEVEA